jgi:hypothetical protein
MAFPPDMAHEDEAHLDRLEGIEPRPVFVMGLHRSGTTFLYETLAKVFPLAALTVHHIFYYPRLLASEAAGTIADDRRALDAHFASLGIEGRQVDAIELSHATAEEYGWLLKRYGRSPRLEASTADLYAEMCRKLRVLSPRAEGVLGKNPWDTGFAPRLRELFPDARFVWIRRHPLRILQSQFRNALIFGAGPAPYLDMLMEGFPAARRVIGAQRKLYKLVGERRYGRIMLRVVMGDIARQLAAYERSLGALAEDERCEISYGELLRAPGPTLASIGQFLGLEPTRSLDEVAPKPRHLELHPEVERVRERFEARLRKLGVWERFAEDDA